MLAAWALAALIFAAQDAAPSVSPGEAIRGAWSCASGPCIDPEIEFALEDGRHIFRSWLHQRPSAVGRWAVDGEAVIVVCCAGVVRNYRIVAVNDKELVLRGEKERSDARYRRVER